MSVFDSQPVEPSVDNSRNIPTNPKETSWGVAPDTVKINKDGLFAGGETFAEAPFSVDYKGNVTVSVIKDKTYGLNGVFCSTHTSTNTSGNYSFRIDGPGTSDVPANGGLLNVTANYTDAAGNYKQLPGFNVSNLKPYFYVYKLDGYYRIYYYAGNIYADVAHTKIYFTSLFNSLESEAW